jgi:hypothetical protein
MARVISIRYSHYIHNNLHVPLLVCVLCHGAFRGFVSIRKWKAMKSGKRPAR